MEHRNELMSKKEARRKLKESGGALIDPSIEDYVVLKDINKVYQGHVHAVYDFNLGIKKNEFVVLVGPSGCGKSTTLRMIAGLEEISSGYLYIDKVLSNDKTPKERDVAMVFQNYALYPHMNVFDNISFGLSIRKEEFPVLDENGEQIVGIDKRKLRQLQAELARNRCLFWKKDHRQEKERILAEIEKTKQNPVPLTKIRHYSKKEIEQAVFKAADILDLGSLLDRKPKQLSGGQMQRVALGRAIVRKPKLFLMDEPLSNLDAKLRVAMRSEIVKIHKEVGATTIYVTHDQTEAMTMANKVVVMNKGFVQQIGSPLEIYRHPYNIFVATFIGSPAMNILSATYDDGVLSFPGGLEIQLEEKEKADHDAFLADRAAYWEDIQSRFALGKEKEAIGLANKALGYLKEKAFDPEAVLSCLKQLTSLSFSKDRSLSLSPSRKVFEQCLQSKRIEPAELARALKDAIKCLEGADPAIYQSLAILKSHAIFESGKTESKPEKKEKLTPEQITERYKQAVEEILASYKSALAGPHRLQVGIRPEDIHLYQDGESGIRFQGEVTLSELLGSEYLLHVQAFGQEILCKVPNQKPILPGEKVELIFAIDHLHLFDDVSSLSMRERN